MLIQRIEQTRRVRRRVDAGSYGLMVVELTPKGMWFRQHRHQTKYFLAYDRAAGVAIKAFADNVRLQLKQSKVKP